MNYSIELSGLDGSNSLAFLAALGTLCTPFQRNGYEALFGMSSVRAAWRPVIHVDLPMSQDDFVRRSMLVYPHQYRPPKSFLNSMISS